ncbi:flagellar FliJ protein [Microbulbifer thermotolerans]|uniref:flagellar export protein FliJ n=1 Tax=Microbulbifer thermotolerans TaxID=252514 RepID=UPI0008E2ADC6|nr:flagellar export protein FliJ [Microbulbifer thermotolerans]WKT59738.1 flagellar export protein FliJ [Microbulbifer thermotolerans]SFC62185.1 flagellar FliJ protein [Microbulbifer thermotolerans]
MKASDPLNTLIDQSRKARDAAGRLLAEEQRGGETTAAQLKTLQEYRREYCQRLQEAMARGISSAALDDYNRFIRSLDGAIARAQAALDQQQERIAASRDHWRQRQRQLSSYNTLAARRTERERQQEQRRERLQSDEITQNILARRQSAEEPSLV